MNIDHILESILLALGSGMIYVLWQLKNSVESLNIKLAVVLERINQHDDRISRLEGVHKSHRLIDNVTGNTDNN